MFDRFTDRARKVCSFSRMEAERLNHDYIGTEHILLGLIKEGTGVATMVLKNLGVDLPQLRLYLEALVKAGPARDLSKMELPFTPGAKQLLHCAINEARGLDQNYVGTEHLLLGMLAENEGLAAQTLMHFGLKLADARKKVAEFIECEINQVCCKCGSAMPNYAEPCPACGWTWK
jgi:ATP-dependent Clp protease ATP-binding subunit ClpC